MPTLAEVLQRAIESRLADVFTSLPGRIETYYPETQTADVLPVVRRALPTEDDGIAFEDLPIVPNVPIVFPRGGDCSIVWKPKPGDGVLLCVQTLSAANWRRTGEVSDPGDVRLHCLGSAFAIPGAFPQTEALPREHAEADGLTIAAEPLRLGSHKAEAAIALAPATIAWIDAIKTEVEALLGGTPIVAPGYTDTSAIASAKVKAE